MVGKKTYLYIYINKNYSSKKDENQNEKWFNGLMV